MAKIGKTTSRPSAESRADPAAIARDLLAWFAEARRDLPWRRTRDPYAIWVSEVMLQQTQVSTVLPYYERWLRRFPDFRTLARAEEEDVLRVWQGLGYYSRARRMLELARAVESSGGGLPRTHAELLALPGIGPYTAGAIASIAHGEAVPAVDGNVTRVVCRIFALAGDPTRPAFRRDVEGRAQALIPDGRASELNQALMELGALVCAPQTPRCQPCPVRKHCAAYREARVDELPSPKKRPRATKVHMVAALVFRKDRVLVLKLAPDAPRWPSMWQFPNDEVGRKETPELALVRALRERTGLHAVPAGLVTVVRHSVTRYRITLDAYRCRAERGTPKASGCAELAWKTPAELEELPMPSAHRQIARRLAE